MGGDCSRWASEHVDDEGETLKAAGEEKDEELESMMREMR